MNQTKLKAGQRLNLLVAAIAVLLPIGALQPGCSGLPSGNEQALLRAAATAAVVYVRAENPELAPTLALIAIALDEATTPEQVQAALAGVDLSGLDPAERAVVQTLLAELAIYVQDAQEQGNRSGDRMVEAIILALRGTSAPAEQ